MDSLTCQLFVLSNKTRLNRGNPLCCDTTLSYLQVMVVMDNTRLQKQVLKMTPAHNHFISQFFFTKKSHNNQSQIIKIKKIFNSRQIALHSIFLISIYHSWFIIHFLIQKLIQLQNN